MTYTNIITFLLCQLALLFLWYWFGYGQAQKHHRADVDRLRAIAATHRERLNELHDELTAVRRGLK
jgi:hypothetical protein